MGNANELYMPVQTGRIVVQWNLRVRYLITAAEVEAPGAQPHDAPRHDDAGSSYASDDVKG